MTWFLKCWKNFCTLWVIARIRPVWSHKKCSISIASLQDVALATVHVLPHRRVDWVTSYVQCCWKDMKYVFKFLFIHYTCTAWTHCIVHIHSHTIPRSTAGTTYAVSRCITFIKILGASFHFCVHVLFSKIRTPPVTPPYFVAYTGGMCVLP